MPVAAIAAMGLAGRPFGRLILPGSPFGALALSPTFAVMGADKRAEARAIGDSESVELSRR